MRYVWRNHQGRIGALFNFNPGDSEELPDGDAEIVEFLDGYGESITFNVLLGRITTTERDLLIAAAWGNPLIFQWLFPEAGTTNLNMQDAQAVADIGAVLGEVRFDEILHP